MATVTSDSTDAARSGPGIGFADLQICYEPFPIGVCEQFLNPKFYQELLATWPPVELFRSMPNLGKKYSLSEVNHGEAYRDYCRTSRPWKLFHSMVKQKGFIEYVLGTLRSRNIDIGYGADQLTARFEFSMLSGDGGHIVPHTDAASKVVTLVVYFVEVGEWDEAWGGGTAILRTQQTEKNFNRINLALNFDEVESLHVMPFVSNSCLLFVKTFNSLHAVYPLTAPADVFRRSVTINLELSEHPTAVYLEGLSREDRRFAMP